MNQIYVLCQRDKHGVMEPIAASGSESELMVVADEADNEGFLPNDEEYTPLDWSGQYAYGENYDFFIDLVVVV